MRKNFILINTSRGKVVETGALYRGIKGGKITGACLDVFEQEPFSAMDTAVGAQINELMELPNIVVTPHIAGYTFEALFKMSNALLNKIIRP
jgi:D-3-phosphoglycerate dehydrogenase